MRRESLLLAALLASGCGGGASNGPPTATPVALATPTPLAVHVTSNGEGQYTVVTQMKNGRKLFTIRALSFEGSTLSDAGGAATGAFEQPHVTFYDRDGGETIADAPKADLTGADKSVVMTGGVQARTQAGDVLHCDRLRYDGENETIRGEGHVVLAAPNGLTLVGNRIDGDVRLNHVRVTR